VERYPTYLVVEKRDADVKRSRARRIRGLSVVAQSVLSAAVVEDGSETYRDERLAAAARGELVSDLERLD
jgi:hypothetical protein